MTSTKKFSQFNGPDQIRSGDIVAGLRDGDNWQFTGVGSGGGGATVIQTIDQDTSALLVGRWVRFDDATQMYVHGLAINPELAEIEGVVKEILGPTQFQLQQSGYIPSGTAGFTGFLTTGVYFLSDTVPGEQDLVEPTTNGYVSKPLFAADSGDSGWVICLMRGNILGTPLPIPQAPPNDATYIVQTQDVSLPNAQSLGDLTTGIMYDNSALGVGVVSTLGVGTGLAIVGNDLTATGSGGAPDDAFYVLNTADAGLPNAQSLGTIGTGIVYNTDVVDFGTLTTLGIGSGLSISGGDLIATGTGDAPSDAIYIVGMGNVDLPNAQSLGDLPSGIMYDTSGGGLGTVSTLGIGTGLAISGGNLNVTASGGAPVNAKYIVQEVDAGLPNAQSLGTIGTGIVFNTDSGTSGALSTIPVVPLNLGGTQTALADPNVDALFGWDGAGHTAQFYGIGAGLAIISGNLVNTGGGGGGSGIIQCRYATANVDVIIVGTAQIPNMSVPITPTSSANAIKITANINITTAYAVNGYRLYRNGVLLTSAMPTYTVPNGYATNAAPYAASYNGQGTSVTLLWVDTPATTAVTTYSLWIFSGVTNFEINRSGVSCMTVEEIG